MTKMLIIMPLAAALLAGCVVTAPVSVAWRSNTNQQHATTEGRNDKAADRNTVDGGHAARPGQGGAE